MYFLWYLLIGLAAGWIANLIVKGGGSGLFVNLIVGLIGGILGGWLFSLFGWVPVRVHRDASPDGSRMRRSLIMAFRIRDLTVPRGRSSRRAISEWGLSMKKARRSTST